MAVGAKPEVQEPTKEERVSIFKRTAAGPEIDLTGTEVHRKLRSAAAEATPDPVRRDQRRRAHDLEFGRCPHGGKQDECHGRDSHYGD